MKTDTILKTLLATVLMLCIGVPQAEGAKVMQQVCGRIHLKSGKVIEVADSNRIGTPAKKHSRLVIIENAFSKAAKDGDTFEGAEVDSVNIWQRTRTDRVRTLVYEPDYGDKMADDAFRRQIAAFVADDQVLSRMILESRLTRIKTMRMLGNYVPQ